MTEQLSLDFDAPRPRPLVLGEYEAYLLWHLGPEPCPVPRLSVAWDRMLDDLRLGVPHREAVGPFHAAVRMAEVAA